jgi:hypothetical protein
MKIEQRNPSVVFDRKPAIGDSEIDPPSDAQELDRRGVSVCIGPQVLEYGIRICDGELLVLEGKARVFAKGDVLNCREPSL